MSSIDQRKTESPGHPPAWRPEPNERLNGELVKVTTRAGFNGKPYRILHIRRPDGVIVAWHAFGAVAEDELRESQPQVGEQLVVTYGGQRDTVDGSRRYHVWAIEVDRPPARVDWGATDSGGGDGDDGPIPFRAEPPREHGELRARAYSRFSR